MQLKLLEIQKKSCGHTKCPYENPQDLSNFYKSNRFNDGLSHYCKKCQLTKTANWAKRNPEKLAAKAKRLRLKLKIENPHKAWALRRNSRLKEAYGMTLDDYNNMFIAQNGCCAICARPASDFPKKLVVDHNHETGKVRKLLCGLCNQMLGSSKENKQTLQKAIQYLEDHE